MDMSERPPRDGELAVRLAQDAVGGEPDTIGGRTGIAQGFHTPVGLAHEESPSSLRVATPPHVARAPLRGGPPARPSLASL
jgi:hypothetical protein